RAVRRSLLHRSPPPERPWWHPLRAHAGRRGDGAAPASDGTGRDRIAALTTRLVSGAPQGGAAPLVRASLPTITPQLAIDARRPPTRLPAAVARSRVPCGRSLSRLPPPAGGVSRALARHAGILGRDAARRRARRLAQSGDLLLEPRRADQRHRAADASARVDHLPRP